MKWGLLIVLFFTVSSTWAWENTDFSVENTSEDTEWVLDQMDDDNSSKYGFAFEEDDKETVEEFIFELTVSDPVKMDLVSWKDSYFFDPSSQAYSPPDCKVIM